MATNRINVGIYGNTEAGKTHFIYRFLMILKACMGDTVFAQRCCKGTSAMFCDQIATSLKEDGRISPTSTYSETENIIVRFKNAMENKHDQIKFCRDDSVRAKYELTFRDLVGERTRDALDDLSSRSSSQSNIVMKQIKRCDAFLFFLDPTYGIADLEHATSGAKLNQEHLKKERERAEHLIDTVIKIRGNKNLPILFVQTHRDVLDTLAPEEQQKARDWFDGVNGILREKYKPLGSVPSPSLFDRDKTEFQISSVQDEHEKTNIVPLIGSMLDLYRDYKTGIAKDLRRISLAFSFVVLMAACIILGGYAYRMTKEKSQVDISPVSNVSKLENKLIAELQEIPAAWPENPLLRSSMKRALNQITQSEPVASAIASAEDAPGIRLRLEFETAGARIVESIMNEELPVERRLEIAELLTGLYAADVRKVSATAFDMDVVAKQIDALLRRQLSDELRESLDRHTKLSPMISMELYRELIRVLRDLQDRIARLNLSFTKSNFALSGEIKNAIALLQERVKQKNYSVQVWIECSAPRNATLSINFKNQQEEKPVYLNEQKTDQEKPGELVTYVPAVNPHTFTFPLETKVPSLVVSQYNMDKDAWEDFRHSTRLVSDRIASLDKLGMPLVFKEEVTFRVNLTDNNNKSVVLQLRFNPSYESLPQLLWSVGTPHKENKDTYESKKSTNL